MILLDTSAIFAWVDRADANHALAVRRLESLLQTGAELVTHNYVVLESLALTHTRLGLETALKVAADLRELRVEWVTETLHNRALAQMAATAVSPGVSLVDHVSFILMRQHAIDVAFAFDRDFSDQGFELYRAPRE